MSAEITPFKRQISHTSAGATDISDITSVRAVLDSSLARKRISVFNENTCLVIER